jgi:hypothetical protein
MRAPVFIEIALWYYCRAEDHPRIRDHYSGPYRDAVEELVEAGMLIPIPGDGVSYEPTAGLRMYVDTICAVPLPIQAWTMPALSPKEQV